MKKVLIILGIIFGGIILLVITIFLITSLNSKKLKCTSNEGNITIMYNKKSITGYTAKGVSYDLEQQRKVAEQIGIDNYLDQFKSWFSANTTGSCK